MGREARMRKLKVTLKRSGIGCTEDQRYTLRSLGLTKLHKTVIHKDNECIRGMIRKVSHLVEVVEIDSEEGR